MNYSSKSITASHKDQRAPHPFAAKPPSHSRWLFSLLPSTIPGWPGMTPCSSLLCLWLVNCHQTYLSSVRCHMFSSPHNPRVGIPRVGIPPRWESLPLSSKEWIKGNENNHWRKYFPEFPQKPSLRFPYGSSTRNKSHGHPELEKRNVMIPVGLDWWGTPVVKNPPAKAGDVDSIPGLGRSPGEGNGNPLQSPCLGNPMNTGAWQATVHGVTKEPDTTEQLNNNSEAPHSADCTLCLMSGQKLGFC